MIDPAVINELLRVKGKTLFHREGQELEFKEQFNFSALPDYFRDFAAFANNKGGYLIFGIKDSPRLIQGLSEKSIEQLEKLDPEKISGFLLDTFSSNIVWEVGLFKVSGQVIGVFRIEEAETKPVIATKESGKSHIQNGEIYFRYGGRTQKIQSAELENIINRRIEQNNAHWMDLMSKIGRTGPENAAILDTEKALIEKGESKILVIDDDLAKKLKFIKEGSFVEKGGSSTLKLVGDVVPIDRVEVVRKVKENLTKLYPLSATELAAEVKKNIPTASVSDVWQVIAENDLKNNLDYSAYNFRNKKQEDEYHETGELPKGIPSIYNFNAVSLITKIISKK